MNENQSILQELINSIYRQCWQGLAHLRYFDEIEIVAKEQPLFWKNGFEFLFMTSKAHLESAFACCARVIKKNKDSVQIYYFLSYIDKHLNDLAFDKRDILRNSVDSDLKTLDELGQILKHINDLRDQHFAHLDKTQVHDKSDLILSLVPIAKDLKNILSVSGNIVSKYSEIVFDTSLILELVGLDNVKFLFEFIEQSFAKEREEERSTILKRFIK
jgi:hypothetical protein